MGADLHIGAAGDAVEFEDGAGNLGVGGDDALQVEADEGLWRRRWGAG